MTKPRLTVTAPIELPMLPNFIKLTNGGTLRVEELDESQLRALGEAWTDALVQHAEQRRARSVEEDG